MTQPHEKSLWHRIFWIYLPALAVFITAIGTLYQILAPKSPQIISDAAILQENKLLHLEKDALENQKRVMEEEKNALENKLDTLENKIADLENQSSGDTPPSAKDFFLITALRTCK